MRRIQCARCRSAEAQAGIHAPQQQRAALAAQVTAAEFGLDNPPADPPKVQLLVRTLWHWQFSVGTGGETPMTTRLGTRLPTPAS